MYDAPPGFDDMLADAQRRPAAGRFHPLEVPDVGTVMARKPMPGAAAALAMAANSKIDAMARQNYLVLFVKNHLGDATYEDVLYRMLVGELPETAVEKIARAVATWGTARPTSPSSR